MQKPKEAWVGQAVYYPKREVGIFIPFNPKALYKVGNSEPV
jgi:hypothetical protein